MDCSYPYPLRYYVQYILTDTRAECGVGRMASYSHPASRCYGRSPWWEWHAAGLFFFFLLGYSLFVYLVFYFLLLLLLVATCSSTLSHARNHAIRCYSGYTIVFIIAIVSSIIMTDCIDNPYTLQVPSGGYIVNCYRDHLKSTNDEMRFDIAISVLLVN